MTTFGTYLKDLEKTPYWCSGLSRIIDATRIQPAKHKAALNKGTGNSTILKYLERGNIQKIYINYIKYLGLLHCEYRESCLISTYRHSAPSLYQTLSLQYSLYLITHVPPQNVISPRRCSSRDSCLLSRIFLFHSVFPLPSQLPLLILLTIPIILSVQTIHRKNVFNIPQTPPNVSPQSIRSVIPPQTSKTVIKSASRTPCTPVN